MAHLRHNPETNARRVPRPARAAAPIAVFATLAAVIVGVMTTDVEETAGLAGAGTASLADVTTERRQQVSRSAPRVTRRVSPAELRLLKEKAGAEAAIRKADRRLWTTAELNLWTSSFQSAKLRGTVDFSTKVLVTGRRARGRAEIVHRGKSRWVTAEYLAADKPKPEPTISNATCTNGSSVPSGVSPNVRKVHAAVCANFPELTSYGTFRSDGEHSQGLAIDIMVTGSRGWEVADFVRANAGALGVEYAIYSQKIWSIDRAGEGWRYMSDRGSVTANHYDHVHVTTY